MLLEQEQRRQRHRRGPPVYADRCNLSNHWSSFSGEMAGYDPTNQIFPSVARTMSQSFPPLPDRLVKRLQPVRLDPSIEPRARVLFDKAACGTRSLWSGDLLDRMRVDPALRSLFLRLAHEGMFEAQTQIVNRVRETDELSASEQILFRATCDSIAWQLIQGQLCYARRLYRNQIPPNVKASNFDSVVATAQDIRRNEPESMPLISDLTSFVQVGDLLSASSSGTLSLIEVKAGAENMRIASLLEQSADLGIELVRERVQQSGAHSVKQFDRMRRQVARMQFITEVMTSGLGEDPDSGQRIAIPDPVVIIDTWDEMLINVIGEAQTKGWAYDVLGSVCVGCYTGDQWVHIGPIAFLGSLNAIGSLEDFQMATLADCLVNPLALPLFNRGIPDDAIFDLMFGRMHVCVAINVPQFIEDCEMSGLDARPATRREMAEVKQLPGQRPLLYKGKGVYMKREERGMLLMDGLYLRALFHGQRPESVVREILMQPEMPHGEPAS